MARRRKGARSAKRATSTKRRRPRRAFASAIGGGGGGPLTVKGQTARLTTAGMRAVTLIAAEGVTRLTRTKLFPKFVEGTAAASAVDFGIGVALGIGAEMVLGRQVGSDVTAGVLASIGRRTVRQMSGGKGILYDALGDAGSSAQRFTLGPNGQYVPAGKLGAYVGTGAQTQRQLGSWVGAGNGALGDETADEMGW